MSVGAQLGSLDVTVHNSYTDDNFTGKSNRNIWWNSHASRWDGVFPYDDGASEDYYIWKDIFGTISNAVGPSSSTQEVEDRNTGKCTIYWDDTNKLLYIYARHLTDSEAWVLSYNSTNDEYDYVYGADGAGITSNTSTSGLTTYSTADTNRPYYLDEGMGLCKTPNGIIWAANCQNASYQLQWVYSDDGGATWENAQTIATMADHASVDMGYFTYNGTDYVFICGSENGSGGTGGRELFFYYKDASTYANNSWTQDTNVPNNFETNQESDNHICMCRDANHTVHIVCKAEGTNLNDIYIFSREKDGTWKSLLKVLDQVDDSSNPTRPTIVNYEFGDVPGLVVFYTQTSGGTQARYKIVSSDHNYIESGLGTVCIEDTVASDLFDDTMVPQYDFIGTATSGIGVTVDNQTDLTIWGNQVDLTHINLLGPDIVSGSATVTADITIGRQASGTLVSGSATVTADIVRAWTADIALQASAATVTADITLGKIINADIASASAEVTFDYTYGFVLNADIAAGAAVVDINIPGSVTISSIDIVSGSAVVTAAISRAYTLGDFDIVSGYSVVTADITHGKEFTTDLVSDAAQVTADITIGKVINADIAADPATVNVTIINGDEILVVGNVQAQAATVTANTTYGYVLSIDLEAQEATVTGYDISYVRPKAYTFVSGGVTTTIKL